MQNVCRSSTLGILPRYCLGRGVAALKQLCAEAGSMGLKGIDKGLSARGYFQVKFVSCFTCRSCCLDIFLKLSVKSWWAIVFAVMGYLLACELCDL